jgi:tRNA A37 threonylcarbamoyladenosine synthetase subunit TsaC/SUA5/YrdC
MKERSAPGAGVLLDGETDWEPEQVDGALAALASGGLVCMKGDIGYGLFGTSEAAIRKAYRLKGRPFTNPCIFIGSMDVFDAVARVDIPAVRQFIEELIGWTTVAVVLPVREDSPQLQRMDPWVYQQSVTENTLALFLRTGPFIEEMVRRSLAEGWVFVGSSANRSSEGNTYRFEELPPEFIQEADFVLDHGIASLENEQRRATTILNFTNWTVKRHGVNSERIVPQFEAMKRLYGPKD